ncbi:MAG: ABC transporter permease subunit [Pseudomonadota bacterium]
MTRRIWAIALNTYREAVRQKVLYALVLFTVVLIFFSLILGQLTIGADTKIIKDMGLASIMLLGAMISVFMGVGLVFKEVERRTIYTILSKPVSRWEFILGKFLGMALTIGLEIAAMTVLLFGLLLFYREPLDFALLKAVLLIYTELCILITVALVFSSYSSSFMSILFCLSFLVVGHLTDDLATLLEPKLTTVIETGGPAAAAGARGILTAVHVVGVLNLDHFVINAKVVHGVSVSWNWILNSLLYGVGWLVLLLTCAVWIFRRKDLA